MLQSPVDRIGQANDLSRRLIGSLLRPIPFFHLVYDFFQQDLVLYGDGDTAVSTLQVQRVFPVVLATHSVQRGAAGGTV